MLEKSPEGEWLRVPQAMTARQWKFRSGLQNKSVSEVIHKFWRQRSTDDVNLSETKANIDTW